MGMYKIVREFYNFVSNYRYRCVTDTLVTSGVIPGRFYPHCNRYENCRASLIKMDIFIQEPGIPRQQQELILLCLSQM